MFVFCVLFVLFVCFVVFCKFLIFVCLFDYICICVYVLFCLVVLDCGLLFVWQSVLCCFGWWCFGFSVAFGFAYGVLICCFLYFALIFCWFCLITCGSSWLCFGQRDMRLGLVMLFCLLRYLFCLG